MLPSDIEEWLKGNMTAGSADYLKKAEGEHRELLSAIGVSLDSELGYFYLHFGPDSISGGYELARLQSIPDCTSYAHDELEVAGRFLALSSIEGEGIILYDTESGAVFDAGLDELDELGVGELEPAAPTFASYLRVRMEEWKERETPN